MNEYLLTKQSNEGNLLGVAAKKKASRRGGRRPGAGRKPLLREPARITIDMERADLDALSALAEQRAVPVAQVIRDAVRGVLRRQRGPSGARSRKS